jgi:hypothetical protein
MAKGSWTANASDSTAVPAASSRVSLVLQLTAGGPVYLGFGEAAVPGQGICLSEAQSFLEITGAKARLAIHMRCPTGKTAGGGYQTL